MNNPPTRLLPYQIPLKQAGYPTSVLMLDLECFFSKDYSLKKMGVFEYVADPRFAVLGLAFKFMSIPPNAGFKFGIRSTTQFLRETQEHYGCDLHNFTVAGQNLPFDAWILAKKFGIYPRYTIDVLDLARAWDAEAKHDLDTLAVTFNVGRKGRTLDFEGVTEANATPEQRQALAEYACNDVELQDKLLRILLPRLTNPAVEIPLAHATLEMRTKPTLVCDNKLGEILVSSMKREADASIARLGLTVKDISCEATFQSHLEVALAESGDLLQRYCKPTKRGYAPALAKEDSMREVLLNHSSQKVRDLCEAKVGRRSWPLHIKRCERICRIALACDRLLPVPLHYCGAHTGRDSGAEKINLQNLPKDPWLNPLLLGMRGLLKAAPGCRLVRVDSGAIEARVVAWLSGQQDLLANFAAFDAGRDKFDVYQKFAAECLQKPVAEITDDERGKVGKVGILGCGFGMGYALPDSNKTMPNVMFLKNNLSLEMAQKVVGLYRSKYTKIVNFWYDLERAFRRVLDKGLPETLGALKLRLDNGVVVIRLPSSRCLFYHNAVLRNGGIRLGNTPTWGGGLVENVVQATARDVVFEAGLRCESRNIHIVHRIHDELIATPQLEGVETTKNIMMEEMVKPPMWAQGLPLTVKVKINVRYAI